MAPIALTKTEVAGRQLACAVRLFCEGGDPVAVHGLAMAAHEILADLSAHKGHGPMLSRLAGTVAKPRSPKGSTFPGIDSASAEAISTSARAAANFFKHANCDPDERLSFDPDLSEFLLYDACARQHTIVGSWDPWLKAFVCWFISGHPLQFGWTQAMVELCDRVVHARSMMDRKKFFLWVLQLIEADAL